MEDAEGSRHYAAGTGRVEAMRMLQQLGADKDATMVVAAALCGRQGTDAVRVLVQQLGPDKETEGARFIARRTANGWRREGAGCCLAG